MTEGHIEEVWVRVPSGRLLSYDMKHFHEMDILRDLALDVAANKKPVGALRSFLIDHGYPYLQRYV